LKELARIRFRGFKDEKITDAKSFLCGGDSLPGRKRSKWLVDPDSTEKRMSGKPDSPESHPRRATRACLLAGLGFALWMPAWLAAQQQDDGPAQQSNQSVAAPSQTRVSVHGLVRNAANGEPLARALVRIEGDGDEGALTDGEGRFEIAGVLAGPEIIRLTKPGFRDRPYAIEEVGYQADGPAHSVLVTAQMGDLEFSMTPDCAVHGHVELSTGDPAQGIGITLLKRVVRYGREVWMQSANTRTNADGSYRFGELAEGVYALYTLPTLESEPAVTAVAPGSAMKVERNGYPSVFYPDAREFSGAARIRLAPGEQAEANIALTLEPFHTVTATAMSPNGKQFADGSPDRAGAGSVAPVVMDAAGHRLAYQAQYDTSTHSVQASLPDGNYELYVTASPDRVSSFISMNLTQFGDGPARGNRKQDNLSGFVDVAVAGHPVSNVRIPLSPMSSWPIRLRATRTGTTQSARAAQGLQTVVTVTAIEAGDAPVEGSTGEAIAEPAGTDLLEMNMDGPGANWIHTMVNDRSLCLGSFTAAAINLAREPLVLSPSGSAPPMDLTLRDDCATLQLSLPQALAAFLPGEEPFYTVYVVPDFDTTDDMPPMTMHPSSGPTLTLDGLTPGSYHVYVFNSAVRLEYRNPTAMARMANPGQQVTLSPGATSSLVVEVPEH
jgi:hypothetical protein